eukprot:2122348-Amphidinium_carterae.1
MWEAWKAHQAEAGRIVRDAGQGHSPKIRKEVAAHRSYDCIVEAHSVLPQPRNSIFIGGPRLLYRMKVPKQLRYRDKSCSQQQFKTQQHQCCLGTGLEAMPSCKARRT